MTIHVLCINISLGLISWHFSSSASRFQKVYRRENLPLGKFSKISNIILFLFSDKMLVIRAGIHKMLVRIANREDPDQNQFDLGQYCLTRPFWQTNECTKFKNIYHTHVANTTEKAI